LHFGRDGEVTELSEDEVKVIENISSSKACYYETVMFSLREEIFN
jgi:hypothetical protein